MNSVSAEPGLLGVQDLAGYLLLNMFSGKDRTEQNWQRSSLCSVSSFIPWHWCHTLVLDLTLGFIAVVDPLISPVYLWSSLWWFLKFLVASFISLNTLGLTTGPRERRGLPALTWYIVRKTRGLSHRLLVLWESDSGSDFHPLEVVFLLSKRLLCLLTHLSLRRRMTQKVKLRG
jgi:hypothetical protein